MKTSSLQVALLFPLALVGFGCGDNGTASGGTGGVKSGGTAATGGTTIATGGTKTGGVAATGGTTSATGGTTTPTGGTTSATGGTKTGGTTTGGTTTATGGSPTATGGATSAAGGTTTGGTSAAGGMTSGTGGARTGGSAGTGGTTTATGGSPTATGGATSATGGSTSGTGGSTSGTGGAKTGGSAATGGTTTATGGNTTATGGTTGTGVQVAASCTTLAATLKWPATPATKKTNSGTFKGSFDGGAGMTLWESDLDDCSKGDQGSTKAAIEVPAGGSVKNVVFGQNVGDGIHCLGSCTIENVWFPYVCDDAITLLGSGTVTIKNSGFKGARDKTIQHNGDSTVTIDTVYGERLGKLYRSCGEGGCDNGLARKSTIKNVYAVAVNRIAGLDTNDSTSLSNICSYRTPVLCETYKEDSSTKTTVGVNGTAEGPSPACSYAPKEAHALVDHVSGSAPTETLCPGINAIKVGLKCVDGYDTCMKPCAPGMYGFKTMACVNGVYAEEGTCLMSNDATVAAKLAGSNAAQATGSGQNNNNTCTNEWAWTPGTGSDEGKYCVCVYKPGQMNEITTWTVWDCQTQWW